MTGSTAYGYYYSLPIVLLLSLVLAVTVTLFVGRFKGKEMLTFCDRIKADRLVMFLGICLLCLMAGLAVILILYSIIWFLERGGIPFVFLLR